MHLPNELLLDIFHSLDRTDLKSARLVCKSWDPCASYFLFDKIYVAPNQIDLQVFEAITQHPILSKCVRHLVYDASVFVSNITKKCYVYDFVEQMLMIKKKGGASPDNPDFRILDLMRNCTLTRSPFERLRNREVKQIAQWKDHSFFNPGYQAYQEHSVYQRRALQSGHFLQTLVLGLSRLSCLRSVSLQGGWTRLVVANLGEHHNGTPLARRWNPFHCLPRRWRWEPGIDRHFGIITTALARAKTHIGHVDEFAIDRDFWIYNQYLENDRAPLSCLRSGIAALSGIKRLQLNLTDYPDVSTLKNADNVEGLPKLLGSIHSLQHLHITARGNITQGTFFLKVMTWNNLEDLTLTRLYSTTTDLLRLVLIQMPRLRHLVVMTLTLTDGDRWASFIECLRQFHHFTTFRIDHRGLFYDHFQKPRDYNMTEVVDYVMNGGRHPCLSEEQPTSASEAYMLQIDASLRDNLYEMKRSRAQTII